MAYSAIGRMGTAPMATQGAYRLISMNETLQPHI